MINWLKTPMTFQYQMPQVVSSASEWRQINRKFARNLWVQAIELALAGICIFLQEQCNYR